MMITTNETGLFMERKTRFPEPRSTGKMIQCS